MKRFWCKEDELSLMAMAAEGKTNSEIAEALGRSKTSVAHKRARLFAAAELTELNEIKADDELEDRDEQGSTEIERELEYVRKLLDEQGYNFEAYANIVENNMAALMERINDLSKDNTLLRDKAEAAEKQLEDQSAVICALRHDVNTLEDYLAHGPIWRLCHSYESFYRKEHEK